VMLLDNEISKEFKNIELLDKKKNIKISASEIRPDPDAVDDSFTGATVLEAHANFYTDNIAVLDFASLYPTIMISRNLCFSTFVMDSKYKACEGVKYENLVWNDKIEYKMKASCCAIGKSGKTKGLVCQKPAFFEKESLYYCRIHDPEKKTRQADEKFQKKAVSYDYTVVQPSIDPETGERINIGVLPSLLEELYAERKRVKREMAKAKDTGDKLLADILDSTQLAIKVSLNSTYGFLGRGKGNLILKELGSIVTSVGRQLIEQSKAYVEGPFIEHIRESKLVTAEIKKVSLSDISEKEKDIILSSFKA
jgi:DNA polymerase elongation subunit (family B)